METQAQPQTSAETDASSPDLAGVTVCQVIPALQAGGAERTTLEVARGVVRAGGRSLVVSGGGGMVAQLEREASTHVAMNVGAKNPLVLARARARLRALIDREGVSLVHARSRAPAWPAYAAARGAGVPFVTTYHGAYSARTKAKKLYNSVMARGDVAIANSRYTAQVVRETYEGWSFFDAGRLVTIPRGADLARFAPDAVTPDRLADTFDRLGGQDAVRVLLPGRLTDWKGHTVLIEAAQRLQATEGLPALRVALVGDAQGRTTYEEGLRRMIEEADLTRVVSLAGPMDDMPAAYAWSDIVVSASVRPEAFGRVAVEAMAMARPVIATAHGGSLETVADGETGTLVPPGDADALAEAIGALARDPDARAAMGQRGRRRAVSRYSTDAMVTATLRVYASLINREGAAA